MSEITLPSTASVYKTLRFEPGKIPKGLLKAHHLKADTWGRLTVLSGDVMYVDYPTDQQRALAVGDHQIIAPERMHHIEPSDDASVQIEFLK